MQNNLQRQKISVAWGWGEGFEYVGGRDEKGNKEILGVTVTVIF